MSLTRRLLGILGRRAFLAFGLVTFLVSALLATVNLTSRYALKLYVEDQLSRIPWDLAVYQNAGIGGREDVPGAIREVEGIERVETLTFLRARFPEGGEVVTEVDGQPLTTPWLCLLSASDLSLLPPQLSFALEGSRAEDGRPGAVLALVGPERAMGGAFLALQGSREFEVKVRVPPPEGHDHGPPLPQEYLPLFETPIRSVIRLDRDELNRWLMDQTGSVSYVPYVGVMLLMPHDAAITEKFDAVATGIVPLSAMGYEDADPGHIQLAQYEPEMAYLGRLDRDALISGWDIAGSLARVSGVTSDVALAADQASGLAWNEPWRAVFVHEPSEPTGKEKTPGFMGQFVVDSTTEVLLWRMDRIARMVGLLSLLIALPLLWMAWVLAGNLAGLLMLNERRILGLMRLRGISGGAMGRALLAAVVAGGFVGGALGLAAGSVVPLMIYEGGRLPLEVIRQPGELSLAAGFLVIAIALALLVSRRLVRFAMHISPLEASRRVSGMEAASASLRFSWPQLLALALGTYVLAGWIFDLSFSEGSGSAALQAIDRVLDFLGLPLFLYGVTTLLAARRQRIQHAMAPLTRPIGGHLGRFAMQHVAVKPHRTMAFLLIVALAASVSLYPTITGRSFEDKAVRGARVQLGTEWQLLYNAPDLAEVVQPGASAAAQLAALAPEIERLRGSIAGIEEVESVTYLVEGLLPSFYLPGYGLKGVPIYLLPDDGSYLQRVYSEPEVGVEAPFAETVGAVLDGRTGTSPPISEFWRLSPGDSVLLGTDTREDPVLIPSAGTLAFLPGIPPRSVTDRQGYVSARVDYLNYLFSNNAYLVAPAADPTIAELKVLMTRVILLVSAPGIPDAAGFEARLAAASPYPPLEIHDIDGEISKVGSDMFIALALANMRIYIVGGLALALIAILAIAAANYVEDRRTLALLRIRGASPTDILRFVMAMLLSPAALGLVLGGLAALVAGFGLANYVWQLRELRTVVQLLPTRLVASSTTAWVSVVLVVLLMGTASAFSWWVFRKTAHQGIREA